jgi:CheY-like chemotaxis protein
VVVVDDEADIRTLMRFSLGSHPYLDVVGEAGDGNQAVDVVKRLKPDLLILDIQMPRKSGLEALPEIAQLSPDDPAITRLNRRFHLRIYECSRSSLLANLIQQTWRTIQGGPQVVWRPHEESVSQHAAMLEALRDRDGERLAKLTREHIEGAVAQVPGLAVAGATLHGVGIPACIATADAAARALADQLLPPRG